MVRVEDRENFVNYLNQNKIQTLIHYPIPPHQQQAYANLSGLNLPVTELIHRQVVSLPMDPYMSLEDCHKIVEVVNGY